MSGYTSTNNTNIGYRWETTLQYDAAGNPVMSYTNRYYNNVRDTMYSSSDSLLYQNNRVAKKFNYYYYGQLYHPVHVYSYNANGNMLADSSINNFQDGTTRIDYTSFTYDDNENIIQWETFPKRLYANVNPIKATYITTPNVYTSLGNWLYFVGNFITPGSPVLLSKYNVSKIDYGPSYGTNTTASYSYEYDSDGFITKIIITGNYYGGETKLITTFYYE